MDDIKVDLGIDGLVEEVMDEGQQVVLSIVHKNIIMHGVKLEK